MKSIALLTALILLTIACKKKDTDGDGDGEPKVIGTAGSGVTDVEGYAYPTVVIGSQEWMAQNLRVSHFSNGDTIFSGRKVGDISGMGSPQFFFYPNNDSLTNLNRYGRLYTYYIVEDLRNVCPNGWRVPTKSDWDTLVLNVGGDVDGGGHLKSTSYWEAPNAGGDNLSMFNALPAGYREPEDVYKEVTQTGGWWTTTADTADRVWTYYLKYTYSYVFESPNEKKKAFSVRCIKN